MGSASVASEDVAANEHAGVERHLRVWPFLIQVHGQAELSPLPLDSEPQPLIAAEMPLGIEGVQ